MKRMHRCILKSITTIKKIPSVWEVLRTLDYMQTMTGVNGTYVDSWSRALDYLMDWNDQQGTTHWLWAPDGGWGAAQTTTAGTVGGIAGFLSAFLGTVEEGEAEARRLSDSIVPDNERPLRTAAGSGSGSAVSTGSPSTSVGVSGTGVSEPTSGASPTDMTRAQRQALIDEDLARVNPDLDRSASNVVSLHGTSPEPMHPTQFRERWGMAYRNGNVWRGTIEAANRLRNNALRVLADQVSRMIDAAVAIEREIAKIDLRIRSLGDNVSTWAHRYEDIERKKIQAEIDRRQRRVVSINADSQAWSDSIEQLKLDRLGKTDPGVLEEIDGKIAAQQTAIVKNSVEMRRLSQEISELGDEISSLQSRADQWGRRYIGDEQTRIVKETGLAAKRTQAAELIVRAEAGRSQLWASVQESLRWQNMFRHGFRGLPGYFRAMRANGGANSSGMFARWRRAASQIRNVSNGLRLLPWQQSRGWIGIGVFLISGGATYAVVDQFVRHLVHTSANREVTLLREHRDLIDECRQEWTTRKVEGEIFPNCFAMGDLQHIEKVEAMPKISNFQKKPAGKPL